MKEGNLSSHDIQLCVWHPKPKAQPCLGLRVAPGDLVSRFLLTPFSFFLFPLSSGFKGQRLYSSSLVKDRIYDRVLVLESSHLRITWHSLETAA